MGLIYTLAHPITHEIRYIGKTERSLLQRLTEHRYSSRKKSTHVANWIRSLGSDPIIEILEEVPNGQTLNIAESYWIQVFRGWGFRLINHTNGGEGIAGWVHTESAKLKIGRASKGRKNPHIHKAQEKALLKIRGRKQSDQERLKRAKGGRPFFDQFGNRYLIQKEAARRLGIHQGSISNVLKGKSASAHGYVFKFEDNLTPTEGVRL